MRAGVASFAQIWKFRRVNGRQVVDIELLFDDLPEPIDLGLDLADRVMYWTDRGETITTGLC
jgi:hypothetical protein